MGIDLGGGEALVAQEFLNDPQVRSPFEQMGGVGVAKRVGVEMPRAHPMVKDSTNVTWPKRAASSIEEK